MNAVLLRLKLRTGLAAAMIVLALAVGAALWGRQAATLAHPVAGLTQAELGDVGVSPPPGARAPLDLAFPEVNGRARTLRSALAGKPGVLVFADYGCTSLCGPTLTLTQAGLEQSGLAPGADYRLVIVGLAPGQGAEVARAMVDRQLGAGPIRSGATPLLGDRVATPALGRALGYRYRYDPAHDQFAHPVAAFVLAPDGRLTAALSQIGLTGRDLRLALAAAAQGRVGDLGDQIRLHCYGFNAVVGAYDVGVTALLKIGGLAVVAALAATVLLLNARKSVA